MSGWQFNLESAEFLAGRPGPSRIAFDRSGQIVDSHAGPEVRLDDVIVLPGLTNSHEHLEFDLYPQLGSPPYRNLDQWSRDVHSEHRAAVQRIESIPREVRQYWGLLRNLSWGVTTVMDHAQPSQRPRFKTPVRVVDRYRFVHRADTPLAWIGARRARGAGPLVFHVAEGTVPAVARRSARFLRLLRDRGPLIGIHGILLEPEEAKHLTALVWCPASNLFLFQRSAKIARLAAETEILFGTDASISATGSLWDHLRLAREQGQLSDAHLLESVTSIPARVWQIDNAGDLVIVRRKHSNVMESLFAITPADVLAVVSQGQLAFVSESFLADCLPNVDIAKMAPIQINGVHARIFCKQPELLERLAAIEGSPIRVRADS